MSAEYRRNHYVPEWYQKRFIPDSSVHKELLLLNLKPESFVDGSGVVRQHKCLRRLGPKHCFVQDDLYRIAFGAIESTEIERVFFGQIDSEGRKAVEHFSNYNSFASGSHEAFPHLLRYLSTQKLRTPKGLGWLSERAKTNDQNVVLAHLVHLQRLFCAIWTESVWLIADASQSSTKFIVSDHPITIYNREYGPRSQCCRSHNDPDIWQNGSHTIFPLSLDKVLIFTNLSWVRNPYQSAKASRPNPNLLRNAMFKFTDIQTRRSLSEDEVRQINFIIKNRAFRYVAAGCEDWLYPERHVSKSDWTRYGHGYLLMPDPRSVSFTREIIIGVEGGGGTSFDEYGRRPWETEFRGGADGSTQEWQTFNRFQGEFARLFGRRRRGRRVDFTFTDPEEDSQEMHDYHLGQERLRPSR